MVHEGRSPPKPIWAYAYQIVPPQPADRLATIKALLDEAHVHAKLRAQTWEGRFVEEQQITHILVVTDTPDQSREVNLKLEAQLRALNTGFALTAPMAVADDTIASGADELGSPLES
jgi:hypothetical protein